MVDKVLHYTILTTILCNAKQEQNIKRKYGFMEWELKWRRLPVQKFLNHPVIIKSNKRMMGCGTMKSGWVNIIWRLL